MAYLKSEPIFMENVVDTFKTEEKCATDIIRLLKDHVILLFSYGVESMPNQGHLGVMHIANKKLYLDGTELDLETATKFLYSSKMNHALIFEK